MDRYHILVLPSWYYDLEQGAFVHAHARMTVQQGHQVGLIFVRRSPLSAKSRIEFDVKDNINIGVLHAYSLPKMYWMISMWKSQYLRLFQKYTERHGQPDLIHAHGYIAGIAAYYLSKHTGIPYLVTEHSTALPEGIVPRHHRKDLRSAYADASALIAVSAFLKRAMEPWLSEPREIQVIGNPVDFSRFQLKRESVPKEQVQLITIGSLEKRKNYALLLKALDAMGPGHKPDLLLIGTGPEKRMLEQTAKQLGVDRLLSFAGYVPENELIDKMRTSDFFISSSEMENFGVAIVEAMACGLPIIATRSGGPEEYLNEKVAQLSKAGDVHLFSQAIQEAIARRFEFDPEYIRNHVKEKFDFPVIGPQVTAVYKRILDNG